MILLLCAVCHAGPMTTQAGVVEIIELESISVYDLWLLEQDEPEEEEWGPYYIEPDYYPVDDY